MVELLVVIGIIAILAAISLPVYSSVFKKTNEAVTLSNMRQVGVACLLYVGDNDYKLPNRAQALPGQTAPDKWPKLFSAYLQDLRVYVSPIPDINGKTYKVTDLTTLTSNTQNNTSYISNGYNDLGALTNPNVFPRMNIISQPSQVVLFGIPYPQMNQFYMDFSEGAGNNNDVLNRNAFGQTDGATSVYLFSDGSAKQLKYYSADNMKLPPTSADRYTDWLWLIDKTDTSIIQ